MNIDMLEDFMLTGKRLAKAILLENKDTGIKYSPDKKKHTENLLKKQGRDQMKTQMQTQTQNLASETSFIFPSQKDTLFWCFYIMKHGIDAYNALENINIVVEKKMKIEYVETLRKNKHVVKSSKLAPLVYIENLLANETQIDVKTFFTLCILEKISLLYLNKKTFFLLNTSEDDTCDPVSMHVVKRNDVPLRFGIMENEKPEKIKEYMDTLYKIENISKPIKGLSSYKVSELVDMSKKLGLETTNKTTNKQKTKNELYELLVQQF